MFLITVMVTILKNDFHDMSPFVGDLFCVGKGGDDDILVWD